MKQLTEEQISRYKKLAQEETSKEYCADDWNPYEISGGNYDDAYFLGCKDADIENARVILDVLGVEY